MAWEARLGLKLNNPLRYIATGLVGMAWEARLGLKRQEIFALVHVQHMSEWPGKPVWD